MSPWLIILSSAIWFIGVLQLELYIDVKAWREHKGVRHRSKPLRRGLLLLPTIVGLVMAHPGSWFVFLWPVLGLLGFAWWLLFDGLYNKRRCFPWWFNGGHDDPTEPDDSWLDQILSNMSDKEEAWLKIGGSVLFILIYSFTLILKQ